MWTLNQLWPVHSLCKLLPRSRKWKSSLTVRCPGAALMRVFASWKVTLLSYCLPLAASLVSSSAFPFLEDYSGLLPTACLCLRPHEGFCKMREFSSPDVAFSTDNVSDRKNNLLTFVAGVSDRGVTARSSIIMVCLCVCAFRCCLSPRPIYWTPSLNRCVIAWR